jgi:hypothetical protein
MNRPHREHRLHRRGFGVSHSYWFDGSVLRSATARLLSRLNGRRTQPAGKERTGPSGPVSESDRLERSAHLVPQDGRTGAKPFDSDGRQDNDGRCIPSLLRALSAVRRTAALVEEEGLAPCYSAKSVRRKLAGIRQFVQTLLEGKPWRVPSADSAPDNNPLARALPHRRMRR